MRSRRARTTKGQALVETVVWLPVLVLVFLSLFYLKGLVDTKMTAIEAARYVTWEHAWWVREGVSPGPKPGATSDEDLKTQLQALGLGEPKTVKKLTEDLPTYVGRVKGPESAPAAVAIPAFLQTMLGGGGGQEVGSSFTDPDQGDSASTGQAQAGTTNGTLEPPGGKVKGGDASLGLPSDANNAINKLLDFVAKGSFLAHGFFAAQTGWADENRASVVSMQVTYAYAPQGSALFPAVDISQTMSLLSHPFHIQRSDDDTEYERLVGKADFDCFTSPGHIVDLWMYPSGEFFEGGGTLSTVARGPKCVFAGIGKILSFLELFTKKEVGYHVPSGTLKEYPELDAPRSSSTGGLP